MSKRTDSVFRFKDVTCRIIKLLVEETKDNNRGAAICAGTQQLIVKHSSCVEFLCQQLL